MTKAQKTARLVNLDDRLAQARSARAAARAEAGEQALSVRLGGVDYDLPPEMPLDALDAMAALSQGDATGTRPALVAILGPAAAALEHIAVSVDDALELFRAIDEAYGVDMGEASASSGS